MTWGATPQPKPSGRGAVLSCCRRRYHHPGVGGASSRPTWQAGELTAIAEALRQVPWPTDGVTMRVGAVRAAALVLGIHDGHTSPEPDLVAEARALLARVRHGGHQLWWAGFPDSRDYVWADRAHAMAVHGLRGPWGALGARWDGWNRHHPPAGESCPICLDGYADPFPSPDGSSIARPGLFQCPGGFGPPINLTHSVCRDCDAGLRLRMERCPLCRADRTSQTRAVTKSRSLLG